MGAVRVEASLRDDWTGDGLPALILPLDRLSAEAGVERLDLGLRWEGLRGAVREKGGAALAEGAVEILRSVHDARLVQPGVEGCSYALDIGVGAIGDELSVAGCEGDDAAGGGWIDDAHQVVIANDGEVLLRVNDLPWLVLLGRG